MVVRIEEAPWVDGDGLTVPLVLRWQPPPPATVLGWITGYTIAVAENGLNKAGQWRTLVPNTRSKATKLALPSAWLDPGVEYIFRVAPITSSSGGDDVVGSFSAPSTALVAPGEGRSGIQGQAEASTSADGATLADVRAEIRTWQRTFETASGRMPTDVDKAASSEYRQLARRYKALQRGEQPKERGGRTGERERSPARRSNGHRERSRGEETRQPRGSGARRGGSRRHEARSRRRSAEVEASSADVPAPTDPAADVAELDRLDRLLERWEADFEARNGRPSDGADRQHSRFFSEMFHKRLEVAAHIEAAKANGGTSGHRSRKAHRHNSSAAAARPTYPSAPTVKPTGRGTAGGGGAPATGRAVDDGEEGLESYAEVVAARAGDGMPTMSMSEGQLARAVQLFRAHDADGDGTLQYAEFATVVRELMAADKSSAPIDQMHLRAAFHRLDADNSREIDFNECGPCRSHEHAHEHLLAHLHAHVHVHP